MNRFAGAMWRSAIVVIASGFVLGQDAAVERSRATARPNVILIVSDDAGYVDFGFTGATDVPTPNLDALAAAGVVCTQGYVTASVCCPSRAGLLTGRYQQRFGHEFNGPGRPEPGYEPADMGLAPSERTLADALRDRGYRTACIGKWHLGTLPAFVPQARGFDTFHGLLGGSRSYRTIAREPSRPQRLWRDREPWPEADVTYLTDDLTDAAVEFVTRENDRPFFLYLAYTAPHTPLQATAADLEAFADLPAPRRRYAAMIVALDRGIGRLQAALAERGVVDDTLIVFVNDNGGATNNGSDNGPWRGMKGSKWEGGIRVPFVVTWPARLPAGTTYDEPVSTLDVFPTAVAAAGSPVVKRAVGPALDGVDLVPFLGGERDGQRPHDVLFWRRGVAAACRQGPWKLIRVDGQDDLLFDLATDPGETKNVAADRREVVASLRAALDVWERELAPPRWREGAKWERNQRLKHRMSVIGREQERRYPEDPPR